RKGVAHHAITTRKAILIEVAETDARIDHAMRQAVGDTSLVCVPLSHRDEIVGVLHVMSRTEHDSLNQSHLRTLELLGFMFSAALSQAAEFEAKQERVDMLVRFEAIYNHAPVGIAILTLDGYPLEPNPTLQTMLGYTAKELESTTILELTHPDDR